MGKVSFFVGGAIGYVLGSRAGHQRYEQIKTKSQELWKSDPVQTKVTEAGDAIKSAAPLVTEKVTGAAKHVGDAAKTKLSSDDAEAGSSPDDTSTTYTTGPTRATTSKSSTGPTSSTSNT